MTKEGKIGDLVRLDCKSLQDKLYNKLGIIVKFGPNIHQPWTIWVFGIPFKSDFPNSDLEPYWIPFRIHYTIISH